LLIINGVEGLKEASGMESVWEFKVRFGETDAAGIVYYPNFYSWMDQASHEMFSGIGMSTNKLLKEHKGFPLVEAFCQFKNALHFDDWIKIVSTVVEVRNNVFKLQHTFYLGDIIAAEGYEIRVWIDSSSGSLKAMPIPEELRAALLRKEYSE
jgi:4-hydroxybenzoyl-CoA thioesterase